MKPKHIVTAILLAFIAVSVAFLVMKERRPGSPGDAAPTEGATPSESVAPVEGAVPAPQTSVENTGEASTAPAASVSTVVYYFHGTRRCPTCRKLEEYTHEAIMTAFAEDITNGAIVWQPINTDEPGNEHYVRDYDISTKSVILSAVTDGNEARWKNLPRIWELVGDKTAFIAYIQSEVEAFREGR